MNPTSAPAKQEIEELIRRLESASFSAENIKEAGQLLSEVQSEEISYGMALGFTDSKFSQVRLLGLAMLESIAPKYPAAKGFLIGSQDAAKVLKNGNLPPPAKDPNKPDYSGLAEAIKLMLREDRENKKRNFFSKNHNRGK